MSAESDELARELFIGDNYKQSRETSIQDWTWLIVTGKARGSVEHYKTMAAHMLAVGYQKQPRTLREASDAYPLETAYGGAEHAVMWLKERADQIERNSE